jgi:hypothetical protein
MSWLSLDDRADSGLVSRWFRDAPSGTGRADGQGVGTAMQARFILGVFILTQVLDGALTYWGVTKFGIGVESNTWLVSLMEAIGPAAALFAAKTLAVACGFILFATTSFKVLTVATGWCLGFAVVPWMILFTAFGQV